MINQTKRTFVNPGYQETTIDDQFNHLNHQKQQAKKERKANLNSFGHDIQN